ncbi:MAG: hypothetical protein LQ345_001472 [Seirophora villosa]|nr:MAG: hypothetical protein LQ345_001472 [Seirophora villosa]
MKSAIRIFFALAFLLQIALTSAHAASSPPTSLPPRAGPDEPTDPLQINVYRSTVSVIFSNWLNPRVPVERVQVFDIARKALYDIVGEIVRAPGEDVRVPEKRVFQWCSRLGRRGELCLWLSNAKGKFMTWSVLKDAISGVVDFGFEGNFCIARRISVVSEKDGFVGQGELLLR